MRALDHRYASIGELSRGLRARRFSALELAETVLAALASVAPRFNGLASLTADRARLEAARADRVLARRAGTALTGIPYGAKDLLAARGAPTTWGAPEFKDQILDEDATTIARLSRRGAVLVAKLAMVELAGGGRPSFPGASLHGPGRNPWDPTRYSGGSSSGSAIAVATGLVPFALGSETGGSILGPCAYSGVTGIRPTYGLVSRYGAMTLSWSLDKIGVLARSASDVALALETIAGLDARDPTAAGRFRRLAPPAARGAVRRARIGVAGDDVEACEPHLRSAVARGLAELERVTPNISRAAIRDDLPFGRSLECIMLAEAATVFAKHLEAPSFDLVDGKQLTELRAGLEIRARDYLEAQHTRAVAAAEFRRVFVEVDVLVSASRAETAPRLDLPNRPRSARSTPDRLRAAGNLAGIPGVFVPCGLADDGLPVGLQLVGPPRSEPLLLAIAEAYQRETAHHLARPPHA